MEQNHGIARFILEQTGQLSGRKFQKLVYYTNAWSLVWDERPAVEGEFEAWRHGPVLPAVYANHCGNAARAEQFHAAVDPSDAQKEVATCVIDFYGRFNADELSKLTHREDPWAKARLGLMPNEPSNELITHKATRSYYAQSGLKRLVLPDAYEWGLRTFMSLSPEEAFSLSDESYVDAPNLEHWLRTGEGHAWEVSSN